MSKTQVAVKETKEYALALAGDFEQDANSGFDGMGQEDFDYFGRRTKRLCFTWRT